ncbi:HEL303Cp [Eremothecium sinecaudum]|uniref:HEL303Cp n=1 Tax=Eremothecium sinecaudum TaxID=45286 RepID=A0A0X8HT79_9SACH|nr:HEL303Cp [Eremothecium sinecaudum]AMD20978.1 HEL303Cp [Eremothecium sinecaudum]
MINKPGPKIGDTSEVHDAVSGENKPTLDHTEEPKESQSNLPIDKVESASPVANLDDFHIKQTGDSSSLNGDLLSVSSCKKGRQGSIGPGASSPPLRPSFDNYSFRQSVELSSVFGGAARNGTNRSNVLEAELAAYGRKADISPLGSNSIYEVVMNTRLKGWIKKPTVANIPPVNLSKSPLPNDWKKDLREYSDGIIEEFKMFQNTNSLTSMNKFDQLRKIEVYDKSPSPPDNITEQEHSPEHSLESYSERKGLEDIPPIYFSEDFQLDNSRVFRKIIEDVDVQLTAINSASAEERNQANDELQDKLTYYLDTIEGVLVMDISKSSHKFLNTMENVTTIKQLSQQALDKLDELSMSLNSKTQAKIERRKGLLTKIITRRNVERLEQGLIQIHEVLKRVDECKELFKVDDLDNCIRFIDSVGKLISGTNDDENVKKWTAGWPHELLDLSSVPALGRYRGDLSNMIIDVGQKYCMALCDILLDDLRQYNAPTTQGNDLGVINYRNIDPEFRNSIVTMIRKLVSYKELTNAFKLYEQKFITELKNIIKAQLPKQLTINEKNGNEQDTSVESIRPPAAETKPTGGGGGGSKLSRLIKEQTPMEFQDMLMKIFTAESRTLRRLSTHQKLLLDVALSEIPSEESDHDMIVQLDLRRGINEGIKIVQLRMGKIIAVRRELTSLLRFDHFLHFYSACSSFLKECESLTGDFLTKYMTDVISAQVKNYITVTTSSNVKLLQERIDIEQWVPCIVDHDLQRDVNDIVNSMEIDPLNWTAIMDLESKSSESRDTNSSSSTGDDKIAGRKKSVVMRNKTFVASSALIMTIKMLKSLLVLSLNLPPYLSNFENTIFDLLVQFNNRSIASVSLNPDKKSVNSHGKNLSIMGESLDCLAELITVIQGFYQRMDMQYKDFQCLPAQNYTHLLHQFRASSDKLYQAHAPPPPS